MLFIGVALLIAVGLAVAISSDAGTLIGLTQEQTAQIIPLVGILILVAGSLFARRHPARELIGNALAWLAIFGMLIVGYTFRDEIGGVTGRVIAELNPGAAVIDAKTGNVTIRRALGGTFHVDATINGKQVKLIFDTGASAVVLTPRDAHAVGIKTDNLSYTIPVQTANGTGRAAMVRLSTITIGDITRHNIRAFVTDQGALDTSLLGMSFLETLSSYSVSQNSLEMRN